MGILISASDFTGKYLLPQDSYNTVDAMIEEREEGYLVDLMGADLFTAFQSDLNNGAPQAARFQLIYNKFNRDYGSCLYKSQGMKKMLLGFICFEYLRESKYTKTISGITVSKSDTFRETSASENTIYQYLNEATATHQAIQWQIKIKASDYPEYNGQCKNLAIPIL